MNTVIANPLNRSLKVTPLLLQRLHSGTKIITINTSDHSGVDRRKLIGIEVVHGLTRNSDLRTITIKLSNDSDDIFTSRQLVNRQWHEYFAMNLLNHSLVNRCTIDENLEMLQLSLEINQKLLGDFLESKVRTKCHHLVAGYFIKLRETYATCIE